jgi:predicted transcriptional regulator of viral defense system
MDMPWSFTTKQAGDAGYQPGSQAHHVKSGNWVRAERGIYRLTRFPQSSEEQLVIYALWSRNRAGEPEGVYSHQTALSIHELSDLNPAKLHKTPTHTQAQLFFMVLLLTERLAGTSQV